MEKLHIYIGYDEREPVTFHVLSHSILKYSSIPVSITPLVRNTLPVNPKRDPKASTDFADTRFLVPYLCDYQGWAMFIDCDEMFTVDPKELWDLRDDQYSLMVRKHQHNPEYGRKFLNQPQYNYQMKNWSSLMLFNNAKCKVLTPAYVNATSGLDLHQFKWLESEKQIGDLPYGWNHLVGQYKYEGGIPKLLHYTEGSPCFNEYRYCPYSKEWREMFMDMTYCEQS